MANGARTRLFYSLFATHPSNANRARGRDALPGGDRWSHRHQSADRRGQNL